MADRLRSSRSIPLPVVNLLEAAAEVALEDMVDELDRGELERAIDILDPTSRLIALEVVRELVGQHEETGRYREAAALDLLRDRIDSQ